MTNAFLSVQEAVAGLDDPDVAARLAAVKALGRMGAASAVASLTQLLSDEDAAVRTQAARALGKLGASAALPEVVEALAVHLDDVSEASAVRAAAAGALGSLGAAAVGPQGFAVLAKSCRSDPESRVRSAAAGALGRLGEAATAACAEVLALCILDEDLTVKVAAAGALAQHRHAATEALLSRLDAPSAQARATAAKALGCLGSAAAPFAVEGLTKCLADASARVRMEALCSMRLLGLQPPVPAPPAALPASVTPPVASPAALQLPLSASRKEVGTVNRKRTREVTWAGGIVEPTRTPGRLPTLLGTPTPKGAADRPDFCMPVEKPGAAVADSGIHRIAAMRCM